jgi:hypothetical protein
MHAPDVGTFLFSGAATAQRAVRYEERPHFPAVTSCELEHFTSLGTADPGH